MKKVLALGLACTMLVSITGCKDKKNEEAKEKKYTYNVSVSEILSDYNPHTVEDNAENPVAMYCQMGFVEAIPGENGGFVWSYEMADSITDITSSFSEKEKYKIADGEVGRVWQIKLNQNAVWEDGSTINADTYLKSMELLLDVQKKNVGAINYIDQDKSKIALYNGYNYYNNDLSGQSIYTLIYDSATKTYAVGVDDTANMYVSLTSPTPFWGYSLKDAYIAYGAEYFTDSNGTDYYKVIEKAVGTNEYMLVNDEILAALKGICKLVGNGHKEEFMEMLFYQSGTYADVNFADVGLIKVDDYTFNYITATSVSNEDFLEGMSDNWIVKEDGTFMSYGPYKLTKIEEHKLKMEKNKEWYGYKDESYEGQYQTTHIVVHEIEDAAEAEQLLLSGKIDEMILTDKLVKGYMESDRIYTVEDTCTYRWIFATDMDKLIAMEKDLNDGTNKRVLNYDGFRKAISYAIDRSTICKEATSNYNPAIYLLSDAYYIDETYSVGAVYRQIEAAKKPLVASYGLTYGEGGTYKDLDEAYNALTGFSVEKAKELFADVYDKAISDGNYTEGQDIKLRCVVSSEKELTKQELMEEKLVNEMLANATKGTGFEGKLTVEYKCGNENRYIECVEGKVEMIKGAWGGNVITPFTTIGMYTVSEYAGTIQESCGWNPAVDTLNISYDFDGDGTAEDVSKTYRDWTLAMNDESVYGGNMQARIAILSALETGILSQYQCIPLATDTSSRILSYKVEYGVETYNPMYGYGGVRYMTYNYDDASYKEYIKSQGGTLKY